MKYAIIAAMVFLCLLLALFVVDIGYASYLAIRQPVAIRADGQCVAIQNFEFWPERLWRPENGSRWPPFCYTVDPSNVNSDEYWKTHQNRVKGSYKVYVDEL